VQAGKRSALLFHRLEAQRPRALFLGSYPPRECGIATFTEDIRSAYDLLTGAASDVIAVNENGACYRYPHFVRCEITRDERPSYRRAAAFVNEHPAHVLNLQHEYGLFGGEEGGYVLDLLAEVRKPVVVTLHTTLPHPGERLRWVTRELCNRSERVIVLAYAGRRILEEHYGIDSRKIDVILHGVPDVPLRRSYHFKNALGLGDRTVLSTFGLLSRGKGIEYVIKALPAIFAQNPDAVYLLLGETHPGIRKTEGESYRQSLWQLVEGLGLAKRVFFIDHYMNDEEVVQYLQATDVYVSASLDPNQIVSGTLSYAVACGRAVVATASTYAKELLSDGRGMVVPFRNSQSIAAAVNAILGDPELRTSIETTAYRFGQTMTWSRVARKYEETFSQALTPQARQVEFRQPAAERAALMLWNEALQHHAASVVPDTANSRNPHK
jgi:glycosyltransferase involved in cell wall biosynthesis